MTLVYIIMRAYLMQNDRFERLILRLIPYR
jgi:hypothetical protein